MNYESYQVPKSGINISILNYHNFLKILKNKSVIKALYARITLLCILSAQLQNWSNDTNNDESTSNENNSTRKTSNWAYNLTHCSSDLLCHRCCDFWGNHTTKKLKSKWRERLPIKESQAGIEPTTQWFSATRSSTELLTHIKPI